jgi:hypothetical protein
MSTLKLQKNERIVIYNQHPTLCKECATPLSYLKRKNMFCSSACSAKFNNVIRSKCNPIQNCRVCGKKLSRRNISICRKCKSISDVEMRKKHGGYIHSITLRSYYENQRGHICEECNLTTWRKKPITLNAHHIDGNTHNNKSENIKLICPNCHSQTPNFCSKNRGNGKYKVIRIKKPQLNPQILN